MLMYFPFVVPLVRLCVDNALHRGMGRSRREEAVFGGRDGPDARHYLLHFCA